MASSPLSTQQSANLLNPSYRIPPENLTSIFSYICQSGGRTGRTGELVEQSKATIALTHVCQYWRVTLLDNPKFWTCVNFAHPLMAAAFLERSGNMPMVAAFTTVNRITPVPSTEVLLLHLPRIRKVHIQASLKQLMEFLRHLYGQSSVLEALELRRAVSDEGEYLHRWKEMFELPPMIKDAPHLRSLRTSGLPFPGCFLDLHHLTHLDMTCATAWSYDYLAVMSANPMLEVVILRYSEDWRGGRHEETIAVSLPRLRRMELHYIPAARILRRFTFPPGVHLSSFSSGECVVPRPDHLPNISTVAKLRFEFSRSPGSIFRHVSGYGPNGTFRFSDHPRQLCLNMRKIPLGSLEELSVSFVNKLSAPLLDIGMEDFPSLSLADAHGNLIEPFLSPFTRLRILILQRVNRCEIILKNLCDPHICPELKTIVLVDVQSHTAYWPSLVAMARVRGQHPGSSNIHRVDIRCRAEGSPGLDQLMELSAHVVLVETKPWNHEVGELDWLNDSRFRNLGGLL